MTVQIKIIRSIEYLQVSKEDHIDFEKSKKIQADMPKLNAPRRLQDSFRFVAFNGFFQQPISIILLKSYSNYENAIQWFYENNENF